MGKKRNGQPEVKALLARPTRCWEDNIKIDLKETGWQGMH